MELRITQDTRDLIDYSNFDVLRRYGQTYSIVHDLSAIEPYETALKERLGWQTPVLLVWRKGDFIIGLAHDESTIDPDNPEPVYSTTLVLIPESGEPIFSPPLVGFHIGTVLPSNLDFNSGSLWIALYDNRSSGSPIRRWRLRTSSWDEIKLPESVQAKTLSSLWVEPEEQFFVFSRNSSAGGRPGIYEVYDGTAKYLSEGLESSEAEFATLLGRTSNGHLVIWGNQRILLYRKRSAWERVQMAWAGILGIL
jgi:hypothetical protein